MKRLFTYILALSLFPQIASAAVLVGKTEGTFAVSPKGAATYTIPLTTPKGMSDFKPDLSLVYDSKDSCGIMGLGWSIKGMHTISKVNKCQHFDGTNQGKAYALDGMRMILASGTDGQTGAIYKTEHDQGDIISITATQNGVPATFKIKAADGSIYIYGSSTGRYINGDNSKWALDYAQDALGNYISYTYDQNGGLYPTSITYGRNIHGTAGVSCTISFTYDNSTTKRLEKIECKFNGNTYRSYTFSYTESPSRLISVTEGGTGTSTFAPTTFGWESINDSPDVNFPRINSISNGLGATDSINYEPEWWYEVPVVASRIESIPTESRTTNYSYGNCFFYDSRGGILGFDDITAESSTGIVSVFHSEHYERFQTLIPYYITQENTNGDFIQQNWFGIFVSDAGGHAYRTSEDFNDIYNPHILKDVVDSYSYRNGVLTGHKAGDDMTSTDERFTVWESPIDTVFIKNLPIEINTETHGVGVYGGLGSKYEKTIFERDDHTGLVLKKIKKRKTSEGYKPVSTDGYTYNEYGQVICHYSVAYESTDTLVTNYEYNTKGQLYREYNPLGQYKTYTYSTATGALSSVVEFDGSTTTYSYDGMLRETACSSSSNIVTTTRSFANYGGSVYSVKVSESGKAPITTYYDAWERKVAESVPLATGTVTYTDYQYLPNGKLGFVSFPHEKSESAEGTYYTYDDYQRLIMTNDPINNKTNTWDYNYEEVTSCVDGVTTITYYATQDKIDRVEDGDWGYNDYTEYHYNIDENVSRIITKYLDDGENPEELVAYYNYDSYGRLIGKTDANGVIWQYEYDANGYPYETRIGDSYVRTNYDKFGRLLSKTWYEPGEGSHTVNYTYGTEVKKMHLVTQEQGDDYTYTYTYDSYGKLIGKRHSVTSDTQTEYANIGIQYNSDKQICKKTCTFGLAMNKNYEEEFIYKYGNLYTDSLNHQLIMRVGRQDNWGNVTRENASMSCGSVNRTFDDYGHMLTVHHVRGGDGAYAYDLETGNMIEKDGISYMYDNNNRLIGWGDHVYSYDKMDNITNQPLIGTFTYEDFKVSGMEEATGYTADDSLCISYYKALERPKSIENGHYKAEFSYDGNGDRISMKVYKKDSGQYLPYLTRYYLGEEAEVNIDSLGKRKGYYYAGNGAQTAPALMEG